MAEERRDNTIFKLGILIALALIFYGLWVEGNPTVVEIVELVKNKTVEFLDPKVVTRVNKEVVHLTATPGAGVNDVIYATPAFGNASAGVASADAASRFSQAATVIAGAEATLRALTPVPLSPTPEPEPSPTWTLVPPPPPSTMPPIPAELLAPTQIPAPPTQVPPTQIPPTQVPPTVVPPTQIPPTQIPPTQIPPTQVPPTVVPPTQAPPTQAPTLVPITPVPTESPELIAPQLTDEKTNPEQPPAPSGVATVQGNISFVDESSLTLILTNGDYYNSFQVGSDGEFWFEDVPNGSYNLSANPGGAGAQCAEITVSVPEGHATLTYNYRYYKRQCTSN